MLVVEIPLFTTGFMYPNGGDRRISEPSTVGISVPSNGSQKQLEQWFDLEVVFFLDNYFQLMVNCWFGAR